MINELYIVMPAYNEEANIRRTVEQFYPIIEKIGKNSKLVIVDDGSKDNTFKIIQELSISYPNLIPVSKVNSGHGATCLFAYKFAIGKEAKWIFQTDSDGQTNPEEFWTFWENRNKFDFIIGSRVNRLDGISRIIVTKIMKIIILLKFGVIVRDANTPFRLMKSERLRLLLENIPDDFFLSNILISTMVVMTKEKIAWVPISFKPRQGGVNSINLKRIFKIGFKALKEFSDAKNNLKKKNIIKS